MKPLADDDPLAKAIAASQQAYSRLTFPVARQISQEALLESLAHLSPSTCPVETFSNDYEFVIQNGLEFDGTPFDFDHRYKHMRPVYEDDSRFLVLQAGAQTGKTARVMVHILRTMLLWWGSMFGFFFPTKDLPGQISQNRLLPFWQSNPAIKVLVGAHRRNDVKGVNAILTRTLGESVLYLFTTAGKASTESNPLQGVWFDEVRRMEMGDVQRAMERYSARYNPTDVKVSTAQFPGRDINYWFRRGDQRYFHTACSCAKGVVLVEEFPDCIIDLRDASASLRKRALNAHARYDSGGLGEHRSPPTEWYPAVYHCPKCGTIIPDPREGWWEPREPGKNKPHSYQMPQMLSHTYPAGRILHKYENGEDDQIFINDALGMAHIDETKRQCTESDIAACVDSEAEWAANRTARWRQQHLTADTGCGVDVQRGYLVVVVKQRTPNRKHKTIHLELLHGDSMWRDLGTILSEYDCLTVIDAQPEWDSVLRFAKAWRKRVWLANFTTSADTTTPMVSWKDLGGGGGSESFGEDIQFPFLCSIEKVKGMKWSLGRWRQRLNSLPDPRDLVQRVPVQGDDIAYSAELRRGRWQPFAIARSYINAMCNIMVVNKLDDQVANRERRERRNQRSLVVEKLGHDHFADANLYADVALERVALARGVRRLT